MKWGETMASCDWKKIKTAGEAKAMIRHSAEDERAKNHHANTDIDVTRSHLNQSFGTLGNYKDACAAYDRRLAELDAKPGANIRKDRVTLVGLVIPCPAGMDDNTARGWFKDVHTIIQRTFGTENVIGGSAQYDEMHEYQDAETKTIRTSRAHLHEYVVPERNGKLNAKLVTSRSAMIQLNNQVEKMTVEKYPGYTFMDGTKRKSRKSVEELKQESDSLQVMVEAREEAAKLIEEAQQTQKEAADRLAAVKQAERALKADRATLEADKAEFNQRKENWQETANNELTKAVSWVMRDYETAKAAYETAEIAASGVVKGFSVDTVDKYGSALSKAVKTRCEQVRYKGGKTLWDIAGNAITHAITDAISEVRPQTAGVRMEDQRKRTATGAEFAGRAERNARRLPDLPSGTSEDWSYER